ncbi:MAG: hypothetical protein QMC48_06250 [SAR324 cluster bacterium]|mgnify:FL=1
MLPREVSQIEIIIAAAVNKEGPQKKGFDKLSKALKSINDLVKRAVDITNTGQTVICLS